MSAYRLWNDGLGDHWASLNLLAQKSFVSGERVAYHHPDRKVLDRALDILHMLDLPDRVRMEGQLVPESAQSLDGFDVWATPYFPTKHRWHLRWAQPFIAFHFDGVSSAAEKNPPPTEQTEILRWAGRQGLGVIKLGSQMALAEAVEHLSDCMLFVGCDSGFSHIAHSVGCPTYLLEYKLPIVTCHRHKSYVLCKGAAHFATQADNWLGCMRRLGALPNLPLDAH